jgi:hypothetical protein
VYFKCGLPPNIGCSRAAPCGFGSVVAPAKVSALQVCLAHHGGATRLNRKPLGAASSQERSKSMSVYDMTMTKIRQLPESLVQEVSDFIDFLLMRQDSTRWQLWNQFTEALELSETGFSDYLPNLEDYENRLARGEIQALSTILGL